MHEELETFSRDGKFFFKKENARNEKLPFRKGSHGSLSEKETGVTSAHTCVYTERDSGELIRPQAGVTVHDSSLAFSGTYIPTDASLSPCSSGQRRGRRHDRNPPTLSCCALWISTLPSRASVSAETQSWLGGTDTTAHMLPIQQVPGQALTILVFFGSHSSSGKQTLCSPV